MPAGAPFLPALSRALLGGKLIAGFPSDDPLDLARAKIFVPTRRAGAALADALVAASGQPTLILPRILPLGAFEPTLGAEPEEGASELGERPAVGDLARRMALATLTRGWGEALKGAIRRLGPDGRLEFDESEPPLVVSGPAQAFALAEDLAALIDDMIIEGVAPERLKTLVADAFDPYWGVTLEFLKIAFDAWPKWLDERGLIDRATRTAELVEREIAALDDPERGPVIIAGSTGANRATAKLIAAIARARQGAVVLPDLDPFLDDAAFAMAGGEGLAATGPSAGHPQTLLRKLLKTMGVTRADVRELEAAPPALGARARVLSEALRPAETTEFWPERRRQLGDETVRKGLEGVTLIVAETETEEALALAVAMREALETPDRRAALITPDATLARRVQAELARWGVEVENSAGAHLATTPAGELARLALAAALNFSAPAIASLIERPALEGMCVDFARGARALQLTALRLPLREAPLDDVEATLAAAIGAAKAERPHRSLKNLGEADFVAARAALKGIVEALAPLRAIDRAPVAHFVAAHREAMARLSAEGREPGREALEDLFDEWAEAGAEGFEIGLADYAALFEAVARGRRAPAVAGGHPRLQILGLLEARLIDFDLALVGGLDETVWPPAPDTDAFLNRTMRAELGLSPPERRIGQTAHDFVAALGAPDVIVSRAKKRAGAPTVASRFLQRLAAFAGEDAMREREARGEIYLEWARGLDRAVTAAPARRPEPRPPLALRPERLSVTRIETLRRDPYAIYAERILKLVALTPIGEPPGPREIGTMWHAVIEAFSKIYSEDESEEARHVRLFGEAERAFAPLLADPGFRALRWPRIVDALARFLDFDAARREAGSVVHIETPGALAIDLPGAPSFTLSAEADRIEILPDGRAAIIDYKTGAPPGQKEIAVGFAPQLTLEAAMLARGAFPGAPTAEAAELVYFKLGGAEGGKAAPFKPPKDQTLDGIVAAHFAGLKQMLAQFADPATPYIPRPYPKFLGRGSDYDHLARVREWALSGGEDDA